MNNPINPTSEESDLWANCLKAPNANTAIGLFENRTELSNHERVWQEVKNKHRKPREDYLSASKVTEAIANVTEASNPGKCHKSKADSC